ncbi:hypothetical protein CAP35_02065 [Chitinophagaceae bacterium IBVUCB1]|nr:hypothetical protein CAP35_02065 [Chitinophagaceae bacterium IBVUCB1]
MYQNEKGEAAKRAIKEGYTQDSQDKSRYTNGIKTVRINDNSIFVNGTTYNNIKDIKNSKKF